MSEFLRLHLIRHGKTTQSTSGRMAGHSDPDLSDEGLRQAHRLADRLADQPLSAVYSSDLRRAIATAELVAARHGITVQSNPEVREIDMGDWEGCAMSDLHEIDPDKVQLLFTDPASFQYPGGESLSAFKGRIDRELTRILNNHPAGQIALIAHAGVCRAIIGGVLEMPMNHWLRLGQRHGCLNVIDWHDGRPMLELLNSES